jgi:monomeric isocitrate dehydrogenase
MNYAELIQRLEAEVVWEPEVGAALHEAAAAIKELQARVAKLEAAIYTHRAFAESHDDLLKPNDSRLWALLFTRQ